MVFSFNLTLKKALEFLSATNDYHTFPIHGEEHPAVHSEAFIAQYGAAKRSVVELLNQRYKSLLSPKADLHNWLYHRQDDEIAYFLNEAGSNTINHSDYQAPACFHLWLGERGFIIGVEQKGQGFAAEKLRKETVPSESGGSASRFFRSCKGIIFFDDPESARIVYYAHTFL
ncbi:MAG: hypothetical protein Q8R53_02660 [Nanoarchaeota archaeon]|nr:hypothetical protein [Nanoarchaeota archaeon]